MLRLVFLAFLLLPAIAAAAEDCSAEITLVDERVAGQPDDQKKQMVMKMGQALEQMCAYYDDAALAEFRNSIIRLYPSEAEIQAAQEKKDARANRTFAEQMADKNARAERRERDDQAREAQKAAELAAMPQPLDSAVIDAPPTVKALLSQRVDRAEDMYQIAVRDWDVHNGNLRVLYTTFPDRTQYGLPDWQFYVYVVEVTPNGTATQTLVTSKQASDHEWLALRRGYDEILLMRHVDRPGEPTFLERWSIPSKSRLSSVDITGIQTELNDIAYRFDLARLRVPTGDGNIMISTSSGADRGQTARQVVIKLSPGGEVLSGLELPGGNDKIAPWTWFTTDNGGAGLIIAVSPTLATGPSTGELAGLNDPEIPASVSPGLVHEKRFHLIDASGGSSWESVALERMMAFSFKLDSSGIPVGGGFEVLADMARAQEIANRKYQSGRSINSLNVGFAVRPMVKPMGDGYAALVNQVANNNYRPPIHGQYLVKLNQNGISQEIYLNPLALQMDVSFTAFVPGQGDGDFYLLANAGRKRAFVVHMDRDGNPLSYAETTSVRNIDLETAVLVSDKSGVWLVSDRWQDDVGKPLLWVERLEFP